MQIIDGKKISQEIKDGKRKVAQLKAEEKILRLLLFR